MPRRNNRPATTPEARENQMISLAVDLAERQLAEGTASTPVIVHYLRLASTREKLEQNKLELEAKLLEARKDQIDSAQRMEELFTNAIDAMRGYRGEAIDDED